MSNSIGTNIRLARKSAGLSQGDVAKHFGITLQAVSQWERGVHDPELSRVAHLAQLFGVKPGWPVAEAAP